MPWSASLIENDAMAEKRSALLILTSHTALGNTGRGTGFYYDEMAAPYWALTDHGLDVELASISGGQGMADPKTLVAPEQRPSMVARFMDDPLAMEKLAHTAPVNAVNPSRYACVFLPGGHGAMWDFDSESVGAIISTAWARGAVIGAVCHGPAGLLCARTEDGEPLVKGRRVNSFTDAETQQIGLVGVEPFLLETRLRALGGLFECSGNFESHAVRDGRLVTGQNPQSTEAVCQLLLEALNSGQ